MSERKPNALKTPWRQDRPDKNNCVRVFDKSNEEILVCQSQYADAIVRAVNWCSSRGYLK